MDHRVLSFEGFCVDIERGCLLAGDAEIKLRPKTFALLLFLVTNPGRLVRKQELIDKIWFGGAVSDDTIVQAIGELRRALGDAGARCIRTVPRRGYRFEATASSQIPIETPSTTRPWFAQRRFQFALAVLGVILLSGAGWLALRGPGEASTLAARPAVAILPFVAEQADESQRYLADGLAQDLISTLGRFSSLTVMAWNSVLPYRDGPAEPQRIARALGVRYQIEGSVKQTSERVRVTARLVDKRGRVLWSGTFDEAREDLFVLQERLTAQIAAALAERITTFEQQSVLAKRPGNLAAYDLVLRARPALRSPTRGNLAEAREMLKRATELDPGYAAAWSALAETYYITVVQGWTDMPVPVLARAEESALQSLAIDPADVRAHVELGRVHLFHGRYEEAQQEMQSATAINPNDAEALAGYGHALLWRGKTGEAIEALEGARRIDPGLSFSERFALALAYYLEGRYPQAIEQAERNLRSGDVSAANHIVLAVSFAQLGRDEEARERVRMIRRVDPAFDAGAFGSKLQDAAAAARLSEGIRKAGL